MANATSASLHKTNNALINHAKETLYSYHCNWGTCRALLNSWKAFEKHTRLHLRQGPSGVYICSWKTCAPRVSFSTRKELHQHVATQHLSRVQLICPVKECPVTFTLRYEQAFVDHVQQDHPSLRDRNLRSRPRNFRRSANLTLRQEGVLASLPTEPIHTLAILETMVSVHQNKQATQASKLDSHSSAPASQGHHRGRLETRGRIDEPAHDDRDSDELDYPDVFRAIVACKQKKAEPEVIVISAEMYQLQAREQLSIPPPASNDPEVGLRTAPDSFGYDYMQRLLNA